MTQEQILETLHKLHILADKGIDGEKTRAYEKSVPFNLELPSEEVTHTIIQGTVGTGMSSITTILDSYIRKGPYNPFKVEE